MAYVELNRKFWAVSDKEEVDPDSLRYQYLWSRDSQPGWSELLQMPRVVVLAEAGTGKSEEFKETAHRLRSEGKAAFFCAIEELVAEGIERAFDVGTFPEFTAWQETDQPGWFFLDSVDEARLVNHDHFKRALKSISRALDSAAQRAFVYISGRGSDWNAISDLSLIEEWLPLPPKKNAQQDSEPVTDPIPAPTENNEGTGTDRKIQVFRLAPLSSEQIQLFARHRGVADPSLFIKAIERADAGVFAERPRDLIDLIEYWKQSGMIGSLAEMTEYNVQKKLTESNPNHDNHNPLSPDKARAGAETVAAALTFSRCSFIALPDPQSPITTSAHSLDAKTLLADWQSNEVESLLRRALFDEATYGRARIHHRSVREYLTAQWLHNLLKQGKSRRSVERLIFAERYGMQVVIPSMKLVAAWLALWDDKICQRLCDLAPEILIAYGDPSRLSIHVREKLLRKFAEVCASNHYYDESLDLSAIRRLADAGLAKTINQLLEEYRSNGGIRELLLRTIWQGAIGECAEIALSFALDVSMNRYSRLGGIRAIGACGTIEQQQRIVSVLLSETETGDVNLTSAACELFFPQLISVETLLKAFERIPKPKRFSVNPAAHALEQIVKQCPEEQLLPLLIGLVRLLEHEPHVSRCFCEVSEKYAWLVPHAADITHRLLNNIPPCVDEAVLRTAELAAQARHYRIKTTHGSNSHPELQVIIDNVPQLRYLFFWRAVERIREIYKKKNKRLDDWWLIRFKPAPWKVLQEDFTYFLGKAESLQGYDDQQVAYSVALSLWHDAGSDKTCLKTLNSLARQNFEMAKKLDAYLNPPPMSPEEMEHQREMEELKLEQEESERQQQENRQEWITKLQADPQHLREISGSTVDSKFPNLHYLATDIRENKDHESSKWGIDQWEALVDEFGLNVAEAARDGLMAYWRFYAPPLTSEQNTDGTVAGLVGLAIEARTKPDWARHLSHQEALLAARYALHEINGFPDWIGDLLVAHPLALDEILRGEFLWEFELTEGERSAPTHYMLAQIRYCTLETLRARYCPYILQLLQEKEPWHDQTLENSLFIVLQSDGLDVYTFAELAKRRHLEVIEEKRLLTWLVAWMYVDADGAMVALQQWLSQAKGKAKKRERMVRFCGAMGDRHSMRFGNRYRDFERIDILKHLVPLAYKMVQIGDDLISDDDDGFTRNFRDNAEGVRSYLLSKVYDMPGRAAFETLLEFSKNLPYKRLQERMLVISLRRAAADAEFAAWQPADVIKFAQEGEKQPTTARDLFALVCDRLDDIKYDLEDGDTSISKILQRVDQETELRVWFSDKIRDMARGKYSIAPEEELADAKRPDIRVHVPAIDAPCVIELKISDNWSFRDHIERLHNQLVGQYLRDVRSRFGVFLLVKRVKPRWRSERLLTFEELITQVQEEADRIIRVRPDLDAIKVVGIDLMRRRECVGSFAPTAPRTKNKVWREKP